jgi:hypothetical protein
MGRRRERRRQDDRTADQIAAALAVIRQRDRNTYKKASTSSSAFSRVSVG